MFYGCKFTLQSLMCQELTFATYSNRLITIAEHQAITEAEYFQKIHFLVYMCMYY